jgi:uncharacterized protein (DUF362 family)
MMKKITRRTFMKLGAGSVLALGSGDIFSSCGKIDSINGPDDNHQINAAVAAVKGNNLDSMTRDAIEAVGGMASVVNEGDTVFIKPNFVTFPWAQSNNCFHYGECTKPEILIATAEECLKAGANEVIIGDGSQMPTFDWGYSYTLDGNINMVDEAARLNGEYGGNVYLSCLEVDYPCNYEITSNTAHGLLLISNIYNEADTIISIPVAKTHRWAQLTLALKNFVGVLSIAEYGVFLNNSHWDRGKGIDHSSVTAISQAFLDVVAAKKPDLTIIDFSIGMEGNGPTTGSGGITVNVKNRLGSWLVLASKDIMAADATAARVMNHHVPAIKQLTMGYDMGLGEINEESIEMIGEKLSDIRMDWEPAVLANSI